MAGVEKKNPLGGVEGHPFLLEAMMQSWAELLIRDHETTEKVFEAANRALAASAPPDPAMVKELMTYLSEYVDGCHNKKEEDHLFALLERRGMPRQGGPLQVMLAEHEQSRALLEDLRAKADAYIAGTSTDVAPLRAALSSYTELLKNHFWKETDILYPMAQRMLSQEDADSVVRGIEETEAALGPDTREKYYALADKICSWGALKDLAYNLNHDVLGAILNTLPVELSFVDADDTVRYFSHENHDKIFPRTRGAIGTKVQNCHPQKSVHLVNQILADFKAGKRNVARFYIDFEDKKVDIRYWPVHDAKGQYIGCLETVQDITEIQALKGERRLLDEA